MPISVTVKSGPALERLRKLASALSPQARARTNQKAAIYLHSYVMRVFEAQGGYDGRLPWPDLVLGGRWKSKGANRYFQTDYKILQDTGALRQSFMPLHDERGAGVGAVSAMEHADIAEKHQFGDPSRNLPPRPMLPEPDVALRIVSEIYGLKIEEALQ